jgi:hypothetical protein
MGNHSTLERHSQGLFAGQSAARPGDFPLGSRESRVAARTLANRLKASEDVIHVVIECIGSPERNRELFLPVKAK